MSKFKSKVIHLITTQLCNGLKEKFPDSFTDARGLQDAHDYQNSVDGVVEDKISWRIAHAQFDEKFWDKSH